MKTSTGGHAPAVVTLGELMLRLKSPGAERLFQSPTLEATFGGAEANVSVSLAHFGVRARFVSALPKNAVGDAAVAELHRHGVDTSFVRREGERLGIYFLEAGANQRASRVTYDRTGASMATVEPGAFDWDTIFADADWFHVSGVTPAISASAADLAVSAARAARKRGLTVSVDYNYRKNLWRYGKTAPQIMRTLVAEAHVGVANEEDCQQALGIEVPGAAGSPVGASSDDYFRSLAGRVLAEFPNLTHQAITLRESHTADRNGWSALLSTRGEFLRSRSYDISDIVDRVGAGDSFAAGLIYALRIAKGGAKADTQRALEFATAASCLKHSIAGDFNRVTVSEVESVLAGDASGRVQR